MENNGKKNGEELSAPKFTNEWENTYNALDIIKSFFVLLAVMGFAGGWMFLMLMIISFVTLSYLHFDFKVMVIVSIASGAAAGIAYTVKTVLKYRDMKWKREIKQRGDQL